MLPDEIFSLALRIFMIEIITVRGRDVRSGMSQCGQKGDCDVVD